MKKTPLQIKIQALNLLNEYSAQYFTAATDHFRRFLGVNPFKVDGTIKEKYKIRLEPIKGRTQDDTYFDVHAWIVKGYSSLDIRVKICISGGSYDVKPSTAFTLYEDVTIEICEIRDDILCERTRQAPDFTTRYHEDDILKAAEEAKKAASEYRKAYDRVPYQFRDILQIKYLTY